MNYFKRKLNQWFGWFNNKVKASDIIDPKFSKDLQRIIYLLKEVNKGLDEFNELTNNNELLKSKTK